MRRLSRVMIYILVCGMLLLSGCGEVTLKDMINDLQGQGWSFDLYELQEDTLQLCDAVEGYWIKRVGDDTVYLLRLNPGVYYGGPFETMEELLDDYVAATLIDLYGPERIAAYTTMSNREHPTYDAFIRDLKESYNSRAG
ncbi:MAG: hypothetical protein WBH01_08870 [Dehalococcoidia bacterium]